MIINPIWFYLMSVCDMLGLLLIIFGVVLIIFGGMMGGCKLDGDEVPLNWKTIKKIVVGGIVCLICAALCPSEKTLTKMLVTSQINETNIERAKETVDYIIEKVNEVRKGDTDD